MKTIANIIGAVLGGIVALLLISPVFIFGFAYLGGLVLKYIFGSTMVYGLNLLFNTNRFTVDSIPAICAVLATIGTYFKSTQTNKKGD